MVYEHRKRGESHGIVFTERVEKKTYKSKEITDERFYFNRVLYDDIYIVDPSHAWPSYVYGKHKSLHFISPKRKSNNYPPMLMNSSLASLIIFFNTGYIVDQRYEDLCLNNIWGRFPDCEVTVNRYSTLEFVERYPEASANYYRYSYRPHKDLLSVFHFGPLTIYTDFVLSQQKRHIVDPAFGLIRPENDDTYYDEFTEEGEKFHKKSIILILDPFLFRGEDKDSSFTYSVYDLVNISEPDVKRTAGLVTMWFVTAAYCANSGNKAYAAWLCQQWNKLMHSVNGNIEDLYTRNGTDAHRNQCHGGRRCPFRTLYRCIVLDVETTLALDQLRDAEGGRLDLNEIPDELKNAARITEHNVDRIMSIIDIWDACMNKVAFTSSERKWFLEHHGDEVTGDEIAPLLSDFLDQDKMKNEHIIVARAGLRPARQPPAQRQQEIDDEAIELAAERVEEVGLVADAVVAEVLHEVPELPVVEPDQVTKLRDISSLLAPELQVITRNSNLKARYIVKILNGNIPPELLPVTQGMSAEIRQAVEEFKTTLADRKNAILASRVHPIARSYSTSDYEASGFHARMLRYGNATDISYHVEEERIIHHQGTLPPANAHLKMINPKKIKLSKVTCTYAHYYTATSWALRCVLVLLHYLFGYQYWHKEESTKTATISMDVLDTALATAITRDLDLTTQQNCFNSVLKMAYLPVENSAEIARDTFEVFVAAMHLNDSRFLDPEQTAPNFLSLWGTDLSLNHYQIRNLISLESASVGFGAAELMLLLAVLLPTVYSLIGVDLSFLFQITPTNQSWKLEYDTAWDMFQNSSTVLLLSAYAVMYVSSVLKTYNQSTPMKILDSTPGYLDLITLSLAVLNYKKSMINILVLAVPFLTTLTHSLCEYSASRKCTESSNTPAESILAAILRNVFISLSLIGLKKLFTNYLISSSTYQLLTDWSFLKNDSEGSMSTMKLISLLSKHTLLVISSMLSSWKFTVTCVVMLVTIWGLISLLLEGSSDYSRRSLGSINAGLKICLFMLLLGVCQAKCLHPLAMDSQTTFLTLSYSENVALPNMTELSKGMTGCLGFTRETIAVYLNQTCMNSTVSLLSLNDTQSLENLASVVSSIQATMAQDFAISEQYYLSLHGILSYNGPLVEELTNSGCLNCSQHYVNVLDALSSLLLSCEPLEILFDFYRSQVLTESTWILETLVTRRLQPALENLGWATSVKVNLDGCLSLLIGQKHWQKYVSVLKCGNISASIQDLNIQSFTESLQRNKNYLKTYHSLGVMMVSWERYLNHFVQSHELCTNNTSLSPVCQESYTTMSRWILYAHLPGGLTTVNATRMVNSLVFFAKEASLGTYETVMSAIKLNSTGLVSSLNRVFGSVDELHAWYYDTTDKLLFEGTILDFAVGAIARAPLQTFRYELTDDGTIIYDAHHSFLMNFDVHAEAGINWEMVDRIKELFLNWHSFNGTLAN